MKKLVKMIYARSLNMVIGNENGLPWKIKGDLARFKELTMGSVVIMGKNTWQSLPKKHLPSRINIVVTTMSGTHFFEDRDKQLFFVNSLTDALALAETFEEAKETWIIGGAMLYKAAEPVVDVVFETILMSNQVVGDCFYKHEGRRELLSEEWTTGEVGDATVGAVHRVFATEKLINALVGKT